MTASIVRKLGLLALLLIATAVAAGFLVAALVVWLASVLGVAAALAITGAGFLAVAFGLAQVLRLQARAASRRRKSQAAISGLVELVLILMPRRNLQRLEVGVAAGIGLAALLALLLRSADGPQEQHSGREAPAGDGAQTQA